MGKDWVGYVTEGHDSGRFLKTRWRASSRVRLAKKGAKTG